MSLMHGWQSRDTVFDNFKGLFRLDCFKVGQMKSPKKSSTIMHRFIGMTLEEGRQTDIANLCQRPFAKSACR